jgi:hypothetical protein
MGVPHALLDFSPTANTHAVVEVNSIMVHAPVVGFTVNTNCVPDSGLVPHHCGVSLNSSRITVNTRSLSSHVTGLFKRRGSADAVMHSRVNNSIEISRIWYLTVFARLSTCMHKETITRDSKTYHYDSESDVYRAEPQSLSHWDAFGWIYVTLVLAVTCYCVELWGSSN